MLTVWIAKWTPRAVLVINSCLLPVWAFAVMAESFHCATEDVALMEVANLGKAAHAYRRKTGGWPSESALPEELIRRGILDSEPVDPWAHPYRYRLAVRDGESVPSFRSIGPDGADWTEDDLTSVPSAPECQQRERDPG